MTDHTAGPGTWAAGPQRPPSGDLRCGQRHSRPQRHLDTRTQLLVPDSVPREPQGLRLLSVKWVQSTEKKSFRLWEPCPPPQGWLSLLRPPELHSKKHPTFPAPPPSLEYTTIAGDRQGLDPVTSLGS